MTFLPDMFGKDRKSADAEKYMQGMQETLCTLAGTAYEEAIRDKRYPDLNYWPKG